MNRVVAILCMCLSIASVGYGGDFHTFTDPQGRVLEARIVAVDERSGKVELERQDGKKFKVQPNLFSEADQAYIQEWIVAEQVMSDKNLRISFKKKSARVDEKVTPQKPGFKGEAVHYEISLDNRSAQPIENLTIEYRYFIAVDYKEKGHEDIVRPVSGKLTIERIEASSSVTVLTDPATYGEKIGNVAAIDKSGSPQGYDEKTISDEDLEGIWLKIHGPDVDGQARIRDVYHPDGFEKKVVWGKVLSPHAELAMQRGFAFNEGEFWQWIFAALDEINESGDAAEQHDISEFIEHFFEDRYDWSGELSTLVSLAYYFRGAYDLSVHWLERGHLRDRPNYFGEMLLAELYSSAPGVCDGGKAVRQAERILEANERDPVAWLLNVLASAYARDGQYAKAVETQQRSIAKLSDQQKEHYQESFQRRLELYQAGKPYDLDTTDPRCWYYNINFKKDSSSNRTAGQSEEYESMWPEGDYNGVPFFSRITMTYQR